MNVDDTLEAYRQGRMSTQQVLEALRERKLSGARIPLSQGQRGLWWLQRMEPHSTAYHIPMCLRLTGPWNPELLGQAVALMLRRHVALTHVVREEDGVPWQAPARDQATPFEVLDWAGVPDGELRARLQALIDRPIALDTGPLLRSHLVLRGETEALLLLVVHHVVCDGRSANLLVSSLMAAYEQLLVGRADPLAPEAASYADFVAWEAAMLQGDEGRRHRAYWCGLLADLPEPLKLPSDRPRDAGHRQIRGRTHSRRMPADWAARIKPFCAAQGSTPAAFFLAAYQTLLHAASGAGDIVVGVPTVGRPEPRFQNVVGNFINMIAVRAKLAGDVPAAEVIRAARHALIDGLDHAAYPFPCVVRDLKVQRVPGLAPVFQVAYEYQAMSVIRTDAVRLGADGSRTVEVEQAFRQEGEYELVLEVYERQDGYLFNFKHDRGLYDEETVASWCDRFVALVDAIVADASQPLARLAGLSVPAACVPPAWNDTRAEYPRELCVHDLIDLQAQARPRAVAVRCGAEAIDHAELKRRSDALAAALQARGVKTGDLVGLCVARSIDLVVAVLGITKAGAAYVPLDPSYPPDRLAYMLEDSAATLVLTQAPLLGKLTALAGRVRHAVATVCLDRDWAAIEASASPGRRPVKGGEHLAYVMYTSGSTGAPKGVMIPHRALTNFMVAMARLLKVKDSDSVFAVTTYSFDISGLEMYLPLMQGGTCIVCDEATPRDGARLVDALAALRPTFMQATPSTWKLLFQAGWRNPERLTALCGGEALPAALHREFIDSGTTAWNLFGPTETTIWSTAQRLAEGEPITIGRPIANTQVHVLDAALNELPVGVAGELCIGGDGLATGYRNRPDLTAEKFIDHPSRPGQRLYRTGDLARWRRDGTIEYLGRLDTQVKIRGFRIELGEIEAVLGEHPCVGDCAVVAQEQDGNKRLVAFVARRPGVSRMAAASELRDHLRVRLPDHMIPAQVLTLDALPLTPNGKVDRKSLAGRTNELASTAPAARSADARPAQPRPEALARVREAWRAVLGHGDFADDEGFFSVGGDSFLAVPLAERLAKAFGTKVDVTALFQYPTVHRLAAMLQPAAANTPAAAGPGAAVPAAAERRDLPTAGDWGDAVAIIGISCQFAGAADHRAFWRNLREGRDVHRFFDAEALRAAGVPQRLMSHPDYVPMGLGFEGREHFDAEFFKVTARDAELMDPQLRHLLMHSWKAVEDAGYAPGQIPDTSVFMAASNNFYPLLSLQATAASLEGDSYLHWLLAQPGTLATFIAHKLDLRGSCVFQHTNCSSSLVALHSACRALQHGDSRFALVGAAMIQSQAPHGYLFQEGMNLSRGGRIRAFDASADGMVVGEGVAVLLLKRAADAIADRDPIYALVRGTAVNNDGADKTSFYAPSVQGQVDVIRRALASARVEAGSVSYVEAHGTGTRLGDPVEFAALREAYPGDEASGACGLGSVKTHIGHTDTVAGLAGCIKVALSMRHGELPPSLHYESPNPAVRFEGSRFRMVDHLQEWDEGMRPWRAGVTSLGIGGTNAHAVMEEAPPLAASEEPPQACLVPVSAHSPDRLQATLAQLAEWLQSEAEVSLHDLAYTLQIGRQPMRHRAAIVARDRAGLLAQLQRLLGGEEGSEGGSEPGHEDGRKHHAELAEPPGGSAWSGEAGGSRLAQLLDHDDVAVLAGRWLREGRLDLLAQAWVDGLAVPWSVLHAQPRRRINLPTYPFAQTRHWPVREPARAVPQTPAPATLDDADALLTFEEAWVERALPGRQTAAPRRLVCFLSDAARQKSIASDMAEREPGLEIIFVSQHRRFETTGEGHYRMPRKDAQAYVKLLSALKQRHGSVDAMAWLWPTEEDAGPDDHAAMFHLFQAYRRTGLPCHRLLIGARLGESAARCHAQALVGFERSLQLALTHMPITCVFWEDGGADQPPWPARVFDDVLAELRAPGANTVLYRDGVRHVAELRATRSQALPTPIERGKTYLVTGGFGGIGKALARHLTAERGANVVLTGRSAYDDARRDLIEQLEEQGGGALYVQADVADTAQMAEVLRRAKARFGQVHGVLHAAGLEDSLTIFEKDYAQFAAVLEPKVQGTLVIDEVTAGEPLDFVCYFSTASAVLGDIGRCNYAIANRFQMAYAEHRNHLRLQGRAQGKAVVINWPFWQDGGMGQSALDSVSMFLKLGGQRAITNDEGLRLLETLLAQAHTQHLVLAGKPSRIHSFLSRWGLRGTQEEDAEPDAREPAASPGREVVVDATGDDVPLKVWLQGELEDTMRKVLKLGEQRIDVSRRLVDYGFDSIGLAGYARELSRRLGVTVAPAQFFSHPSIERFVAHLAATHAASLQAQRHRAATAAVA